MGLRLTHSGLTPETAYGGECGDSLPKRLGGRGMSRYLIGMSGDKDKMIEHLLKCESRMLEQLAEIREVAVNISDDMSVFLVDKQLLRIVALCDVYLDKRTDKQRMQDEIDELKQQLLNQQKIISGLMEGDE